MIRSALYTGCNSVQSGGAATPGELAGRAARIPGGSGSAGPGPSSGGEMDY